MMSSTVLSFGHVDRLGDGAADERLRGGHHFEVRHVVDAALAAIRLERAIEHRQMLRLQAAARRSAPSRPSTSSIVSYFSMCAMMRSISSAL